MRQFLYLIILIILIGWAMGAFVYQVGAIIHFLLVLVIILIILGFMKRRV